MKKIFKYLLTLILSFSFVCNSVFALDYSISVTSKSVTVGNSVTLKVNGSGITGRFNISSSNSAVAELSGSNVWVENSTQSITIKTKKVGTTVITVTPDAKTGLSDSMGNALNLSAKKITITVNEKIVVAPKPKSSNNFLSSLTIDGYKLDKDFDKENAEYSVTVKEGTEKIKINAQLADSTATVNGIGEKAVTEGLNTFDITVTAENGSKRTYVLKVTVKEFEPIEVTVDSKKYTVVRKIKDLPEISDYFIEKNITIDENIVEGYYNEKLNYEVVALKDDKGKIEYYIYNDDKYTLYNEQVFNGIVLRVLDKEISTGYKKTSFLYNEHNIPGYQEVKLDILKNTYALDNNEISGNNFYLFYAINMETGKEELYQYDSIEKTVQRYNTLILDMYKEQSNKYYLYLLCSILVLGVSVVTFSTIIICSNKRKKKLNNRKKYKGRKNSKRNIEKDLELD